MARMPGAAWDPLPENAYQAAIRPTQVIYHTAVDAPGHTQLKRYFARADVHVESHFWVTLDGKIVQMMDSEVRADANYRANRRPDGTGAISVETEDEGDPEGVPWTTAQLASLGLIARWANTEHGIPLTVCTGPSDPGQGYHAMWGAPSDWTPSRGKTCPGSTRIRQFDSILLPRLQEAAMSTNPMNLNQAEALTEALYEGLLLRPADAAGLAFWAGVGVDEGALELIVDFLVSSRAEIRKARADVRPSATQSAVDVDGITEAVASRIIERLNG